ncbi:MAG: penicillin-binding transpeptidase domain-containing protein [Planctomycetota bacterium]
MSGSARRILAVGILLVLGAVVVLGALARSMLHDHALWLERSYRNRWAFRDVPTRRGSICDRHGVPLVRDQPRFALELDYDTFRRRNPLGAAVAGARLLWPDAFDHAHFDAAETAALRLLQLPAKALHAEASSKELARDLRFYVSSVADGLSAKPRAECVRLLLAAVADRSELAVLDVLGLSRDQVARTARRRSESLRQLAAILRANGGEADLGALLEKQWDERIADRGRLLPVRTLARSLPFEVAADLACALEEWRGFRLRPAVDRGTSDLAAQLPSVSSLLGVVTPLGTHRNDGDRLKGMVDDLVEKAQVQDALPDDLDLSEDAVARLQARASSFLRNRVMLAGRYGRSGVESAMESMLAGQLGLRFVERDAHARERLLYRSLDVNPGHDVRVTLDVALQGVLERVLDTHARGLDTAMAVIDARSGDILAIGGRPLTIEQGGKLLERTISPAVTWRNAGYVGSLAKPFVLLEQLAAERAGLPHSDRASFIPCEKRYKEIPGTPRWLECDDFHGEDGRDPALAVAESCNVFFFQVAEGLGMEGLRRAFARAGWFDLAADERAMVQVRVPGVSGLSRPRVDPQGHMLQHVGIGYGVKASALSVARAYAALATGRLPTLGLVVDAERSPAIDLAVPADDLALVQEGLRRCVTEGTAASVSGLAELGVHGKTGTAEVNSKDENNAWFAGYLLAPSGRPTLAFAAVAYTVEDHGKESARMIADFLHGLAALPSGEALRRRWLQGEEDR